MLCRTVIGPLVVTTRTGGPPLPSVVEMRSRILPLSVTVRGKPTSIGPFAVPRVGVFPRNGVAALRVKAARWYLPFRASPLFPVIRRMVRAGSTGHSGE